jgi:hypothetical protein
MNRIAATLLPLALLALPALAAQTGGTAQVTQPPAKQRGSFSAEQLEQLVAPIALYPDALLAQVLMAATYPLEIVQAARWVQQNPTLKASVLANALQSQTWDPSVKSMCGVPDVLKRMNDNPRNDGTCPEKPHSARRCNERIRHRRIGIGNAGNVENDVRRSIVRYAFEKNLRNNGLSFFIDFSNEWQSNHARPYRDDRRRKRPHERAISLRNTQRLGFDFTPLGFVLGFQQYEFIDQHVYCNFDLD